VATFLVMQRARFESNILPVTICAKRTITYSE